MGHDFSPMFSKLAKGMKASEIRELLKLLEKEEIISFAGGLPNPEAFPVAEVREICNDLLDRMPEKVLQYGTTEGVTELRTAIAERMRKRGVENVTYKNILITQGAQQGLDLLSKVFLEPGDIVMVGAPTYLGATNAFKSYGAVMESVPLDDEGMPPALLAEKLHTLQTHGKHPKILYLVSSFHNPAGVTIPKRRREELVQIAVEYDLVVVEDSPYGELRYSGESIPPMKSMDPDGRIIVLGTFSKILAPGFRIAWMVADGTILQKLIIVKQAADLCTNSFGQHVASEYLNRGYIDKHIEKIKALYKHKRDVMLDAMERHFPKEVHWTKPDGGLFIWAKCPEYIDTREMFNRAIENNVAYVIGEAFYAYGEEKNGMRINFSYASDEKIEEGIKRLADTIKQEMVALGGAKKKAFQQDKDGYITGV